MKKGVMKFTACCLAAGMTFTGTGTIAFAGKDTAVAGFDADVMSVKEVMKAASEEGDAEVTGDVDDTAVTENTVDTSMNGERAFAQCEDYVCIRSSADAGSDLVGKVYNNGAVTILGKVGDWYQVQSGNATGYVKSDYFATGEAAQSIADEVAYNVATVYSEALTVRSDASTEADAIGTVYEADELEVVDYEGDWMKVALGGDSYGYVNANYVGYDSYYSTAETVEEEQARLDQEWLDYLAQQEAEQAAAEAAYLEAIAAEQWNSGYQEEQYTWSESSQTGMSQQEIWDNEYLTQETADVKYQAYLNAQAAADAASYQAAQTAAADYTYTETYTDYTDYGTESYYEESYDDVYYDDSSYTSGGQSIVNYATQFVGNPYVWGGTSLTNGADCSGFTQSVMANFGISIPRTAAEQSYSGTPVSLSDIQPGDLLFYEGSGGIGHVTMYMGDGQVVHASNARTGITISNYGYRTPVSARRYW